MIVYEYDETGACLDSFEADPWDVPGSWLKHMNKCINRMIDQTNADCVLDYWSRKDPAYVNYLAPMMCYLECEYHGPQVGNRADYPHKGTSPEGLCPECGKDLMFAIRSGALTIKQLEENEISSAEKNRIIAKCREQRRKDETPDS